MVLWVLSGIGLLLICIIFTNREECTDEASVSAYSQVTSNIHFETNENAILLKVTLLMATTLKPLNYTVVPYHTSELPIVKCGHPFVADMVIKSGPSGTQTDTLDESSSSITMVSQGNAVAMVVEVKKLVPASIEWAKSEDVLELLIYCRYILELNKQSTVIGILTDINNWHCIYLRRCDLLMEICKYVSFSTKEETKIIGTLPKLLSNNLW